MPSDNVERSSRVLKRRSPRYQYCLYLVLCLQMVIRKVDASSDAKFGVRNVFLEDFRKYVRREFASCRTEMRAMLQQIEEVVAARKEKQKSQETTPQRDEEGDESEGDPFEDMDSLPSLGEDSIQQEKLDIFVDLPETDDTESPGDEPETAADETETAADAEMDEEMAGSSAPEIQMDTKPIDSLLQKRAADMNLDKSGSELSSSDDELVIGDTDEEEEKVIARVPSISLKHKHLLSKKSPRDSDLKVDITETIDVSAKAVKKKKRKRHISTQKAKKEREESLAALEAEWQETIVDTKPIGLVQRIGKLVNFIMTYVLIWFVSDFVLGVVQRILRSEDRVKKCD